MQTRSLLETTPAQCLVLVLTVPPVSMPVSIFRAIKVLCGNEASDHQISRPGSVSTGDGLVTLEPCGPHHVAPAGHSTQEAKGRDERLRLQPPAGEWRLLVH